MRLHVKTPKDLYPIENYSDLYQQSQNRYLK